jgi:hypothetical protein
MEKPSFSNFRRYGRKKSLLLLVIQPRYLCHKGLGTIFASLRLSWAQFYAKEETKRTKRKEKRNEKDEAQGNERVGVFGRFLVRISCEASASLSENVSSFLQYLQETADIIVSFQFIIRVFSWYWKIVCLGETTRWYSYPCNRPWMVHRVIWYVEPPIFSRQPVHRGRWGCLPCAPVALLPAGRFLVPIFVRGWVDPRAL